MKVLYKNALLVDAGKSKKGGLLVESGTIFKVCTTSYPKADKVIDVKGNILTPPFVDTHIHGSYGFGTDVKDENALLKLSLALAKVGVYAFCPTVYTAPFDETLSLLKKFAKTFGKEKGARILGFHLEGPFISTKKLGAMRAECVQEITLSKIKALYDASEGKISHITVAGEAKNLAVLAKFAREHNIILQIGHTNATYEDVLKARKLGIKHITHLYNAMSGFHHRDLGVVGAVLSLPDLSAEIIADGKHSTPESVMFFIKQKTPDKVFLITDALTPTGLKEGYANGELVELKNGFFVRKEDGVISGSALTMLKGIKNLVSWGYPLPLALQAGSYNPAKMHNLRLGFKVGYKANFICLDKNLNIVCLK